MTSKLPKSDRNQQNQIKIQKWFIIEALVNGHMYPSSLVVHRRDLGAEPPNLGRIEVLRVDICTVRIYSEHIALAQFYHSALIARCDLFGRKCNLGKDLKIQKNYFNKITFHHV